MIQSVYRALNEAASGVKPQEPAAPLTPAVPIKKSVTPDYIISLEDGHKYKSLKRHLSTRGMTPDDYRAKWGLPRDYPMVAASYSAQRSQLAKSLGLGQTSRLAATEEGSVEAPRRGRRKAVA
jgi:predicted transcriptional regulator